MASAVEITLSDEERREPERRAARLTLRYRNVQRAKVVLGWRRPDWALGC
jgi:hypothetical protein